MHNISCRPSKLVIRSSACKYFRRKWCHVLPPGFQRKFKFRSRFEPFVSRLSLRSSYDVPKKKRLLRSKRFTLPSGTSNWWKTTSWCDRRWVSQYCCPHFFQKLTPVEKTSSPISFQMIQFLVSWRGWNTFRLLHTAPFNPRSLNFLNLKWSYCMNGKELLLT